MACRPVSSSAVLFWALNCVCGGWVYTVFVICRHVLVMICFIFYLL